MSFTLKDLLKEVEAKGFNEEERAIVENEYRFHVNHFYCQQDVNPRMTASEAVRLFDAGKEYALAQTRVYIKKTIDGWHK